MLLSICSMLTDPNPDDPLVPEIAHVSCFNHFLMRELTCRPTRMTDHDTRLRRGSGRGSKLLSINFRRAKLTRQIRHLSFLFLIMQTLVHSFDVMTCISTSYRQFFLVRCKCPSKRPQRIALRVAMLISDVVRLALRAP